jgi:hypothetical protein
MSRCILGKKKHKLCEQITGKKYIRCMVRGGTKHFWALCITTDEGGSKGDMVNYKTNEYMNIQNDN